MTAEEISYQLELGKAIAALLEPITRVLAVIRVGDQRGWISCIDQYREMLHEVDRLLMKLGELAAVTKELQIHNEAYVATDREPRH
jgi:hypothetical protein